MKSMLLCSFICGVSLLACSKSEPPPPKVTYPDSIEVVPPINGGPGIRQRISPEFKERIKPNDNWQNHVKLVAVTMVLNNKNCDTLDFFSQFSKTNYTAFRVGCLDDEGRYRVYLMQRHVDQQDFSVEYWKD